VVLEEGPFVPPEDYGRMRPSESIRHLWRDGAMTTAFGLGDTPLVNVTMGRCVGGSSVLTGGVCFRIPDAVLQEWVDERGLADLSPAAMEPYFEEVERVVRVEEVPEHMRSRGTRRFGEGLARRGHALQPLRRNTRGCGGCGRCNFGCPRQAKQSVDLTYLPRAFAGGARLVKSNPPYFGPAVHRGGSCQKFRSWWSKYPPARTFPHRWGARRPPGCAIPFSSAGLCVAQAYRGLPWPTRSGLR